MTFETTLKNELVKAYTEAYGRQAWENKTEEEKQQTLGELLRSFLTVSKRAF